MPRVPPTCHENKFIPDFKHKDELFNSIFTNCSLISKKCKTDYYFAWNGEIVTEYQVCWTKFWKKSAKFWQSARAKCDQNSHVTNMC